MRGLLFPGNPVQFNVAGKIIWAACPPKDGFFTGYMLHQSLQK